MGRLYGESTQLSVILVNTTLRSIADKSEFFDIFEWQTPQMNVRPINQCSVFCPVLTDPFATRKNCSRALTHETSG